MKTLTGLMHLADAYAEAPQYFPIIDITTDRRTTRANLETALAELIAERDSLKLAVEAFIKYDSNDSDDGIQMMIDYDDALTKAKAAMKGTS